MKLKSIVATSLLLTCGAAHAAKIPVNWVNPTEAVECDNLTPPTCKNIPLTNLASVTVEWGTCKLVGSVQTFGTLQASITVLTTEPGKIVHSYIYPTGIAKVCVRAFATNAVKASSGSSGVVSTDALPAPGKPITLGKPVILNFVQPTEVF